MATELLTNGNPEPMSIEGRLSSEAIPLNRNLQQENVPSSLGGPYVDSPLNTTESIPKQDANTDVNETDIIDAQIIADLFQRIRAGDNYAKFELGQFYFERRKYTDAKKLFEEISNENMQAIYQLAVMYYDGLGVETNYVRICVTFVIPTIFLFLPNFCPFQYAFLEFIANKSLSTRRESIFHKRNAAEKCLDSI